METNRRGRLEELPPGCGYVGPDIWGDPAARPTQSFDTEVPPRGTPWLYEILGDVLESRSRMPLASCQDADRTKAVNPREPLDEEHRTLLRLLSAVRAAIRVDVTSPLVGEALSALGERMREHFRVEENAAAQHGDRHSFGILRGEHARLAESFGAIAASLAEGQPEHTGHLLDAFVEDFIRHNDEVDTRLFREMGL